MTRSEFDVWLERKAMANPNNPLYAHVLKASRIDSLEVGRENVPLPVSHEKAAVRPSSVAGMVVEELTAKDKHIFTQEPKDFKSAAAGEDWDGREE